MRPANNSSIVFVPGNPPTDPAQMPAYIRDVEARIAAAITGLAAGHMDVTYVAPTKPRVGDKRIADGTSWNPGSGFGEYLHNGTTWVLVKAL